MLQEWPFLVRRAHAHVWTRFFSRVVFVHINKTGGSSIERALGLPFQHKTAAEFLQLMGVRRFERAFRFTFVRNPWAKVASHYRYRVQTNQTRLGWREVSFNDWVKRAYGDRDPELYDQPIMFAPQTEWFLGCEGELLVDFIGRFERIGEDFQEVAQRLGIKASLPHVKKTGGRHYTTMYDHEAASIVAERFASDIEMFGYEYERALPPR